MVWVLDGDKNNTDLELIRVPRGAGGSFICIDIWREFEGWISTPTTALQGGFPVFKTIEPAIIIRQGFIAGEAQTRCAPRKNHTLHAKGMANPALSARRGGGGKSILTPRIREMRSRGVRRTRAREIFRNCRR